MLRLILNIDYAVTVTTYADGAWNGGGADYAEYFEWSDGNTSAEDRRGISVVLVDDKIPKLLLVKNPLVSFLVILALLVIQILIAGSTNIFVMITVLMYGRTMKLRMRMVTLLYISSAAKLILPGTLKTNMARIALSGIQLD